MRTFRYTLFVPIALLLFISISPAQRKSVSGTEVTGTFRRSFSGKFKGSYSEIKILALGGGKLKVQFSLIYPYVDGNGDLSANLGDAAGEALIEGDTAIFTSDDNNQCKITMKFKRPGIMVVIQEGADFDCGFGHNVTADGNYKKYSGKKPKFQE